MKMPKFKPTKWKLDYCLDCKTIIGRYGWNCRNKHKVVQRDNIPFFIKEMQITHFGKWSGLKATMPKETFSISRTNIGKIVLGCGIEPEGYIRDQWWMWCKVGSSLSLKWLPSDEE